MDPAKLKAHLVASLSALPNIDPIHITTLISTPRRVNDLYPHTPSPPRCFQMDYFVTVGVEVDKVHDEQETGKEVGEEGMRTSAQAEVEDRTGAVSEAVALAEPAGSSTSAATTPTSSARMDSASAAAPAVTTALATPSSSTNPPKTHLLAAAIHAHLYLIPSLSQSILYISKVDSSSYGSSIPLPLTRTLVASFISHFLPPANRPTPTFRVQLFARSQGQYLFPNSAESARKKGISGGRLCGWWKGVYEEAVRIAVGGEGVAVSSTVRSGQEGNEQVPEAKGGRDAVSAGALERLDPRDVRLSYILPSYSAHEAHCLLGNAKVPLPAGVSWRYEPPFSPTTTPPVTSHAAEGTQTRVNIADLIPSLEDDPKQRFLGELSLNNKPVREHELVWGNDHADEPASTATGSHRPMLNTGAPDNTNGTGYAGRTIAIGEGSTSKAASETSKKAQSRKANAHARNAKEDETQRRADYSALAQTSYKEFWERLGFRQECAQDTTGFFSCVVGAHVPLPSSNGHPEHSASQVTVDASGAASTSTYPTTTLTRTLSNPSNPSHTLSHIRHPKTDTPNRNHLPHTIVERLHKALLNTDFINVQLAQDGSAFWMNSMRRIVRDEIGAEGLEACTGVVQAKDGAQIAAMASRGAREGGAGGGEGKRVGGEVVTVLQPRKKKRT